MADEPTAGELNRSIDRLANEIARMHTALERLVRIDVYEAHRTALLADIRRVEAKTDELEREAEQRDQLRETDRGANRRLVLGAVLACVGTIVASVLVQVLMR